MGKGKLSITKKKNYQKSRPKIMSVDVDQLQRKLSLLRPDLNGYLEPLTHLGTVLNIANESCIRSQEITLA